MTWKFKCSLCDKRFNTEQQVGNHIAKHVAGGMQAQPIPNNESPTGRIVREGPNVQNIPVRTEEGTAVIRTLRNLNGQ